MACDGVSAGTALNTHRVGAVRMTGTARSTSKAATEVAVVPSTLVTGTSGVSTSAG